MQPLEQFQSTPNRKPLFLFEDMDYKRVNCASSELTLPFICALPQVKGLLFSRAYLEHVMHAF